MDNLTFSETIRRVIRRDAPEALGRPTRPFVETAVAAGKPDEARQWLDYLFVEIGGIHYLLSVWAWYMVRYWLDRKGEEAWSQLVTDSMAPWLATTYGLQDMPAAQVATTDHDAMLTAPGLPWPVHVVEGDKRYHVLLDEAAGHEARLADWRQQADTAIAAADLARFSRLLDERLVEERFIHDVLCDWVWALLTLIGREWGEAALGDVQRVTEEPWVTVRYQALRDLTPEESLQLSVEAHRGHFAGFEREGGVTVIDEPERYVIQLDQCGSGARMVQGDPVVGNGSRLAPPYNFMVIENAYDWTWGRRGVGAYCSHCAIVNQILPIEWLGRPMRGTDSSVDPAKPCRWFIYKHPGAVPNDAYTEVSKRRPRPEADETHAS